MLSIVLLFLFSIFCIIHCKLDIQGSISCGQNKTGSILTSTEAHSYSFIVPGKSPLPVSFTLCNSPDTFDTELKLYNNVAVQIEDTCDFYTSYSGSGNCSHCGENQEKWDIILIPGNYYIEVHGYESNTGQYRLDMICDSTNFTTSIINCNEQIIGQTTVAYDIDYYKLSINNNIATVFFNLCASKYDTYLYIYDKNLNQLYFNDDSVLCTTKSQLTLPLIKGTYFIGIGGFHKDYGNYSLEISCIKPKSPDPTFMPTTNPTIHPTQSPTYCPWPQT
eukprot:494131_1